MNDNYGVFESNPINRSYHQGEEAQQRAEIYVPWDCKSLERITRLRLLSDPGFPLWDVSYCHGRLKTGEACTVELPFDQIPKGKGFKGFIIREAKKYGVYAKGLGLLDSNVYSKLC